MLPGYLDCLFLIVPSVFSNVYLAYTLALSALLIGFVFITVDFVLSVVPVFLMLSLNMNSFLYVCTVFCEFILYYVCL